MAAAMSCARLSTAREERTPLRVARAPAKCASMVIPLVKIPVVTRVS
jgi:hypothetical protein